MSKLICFGHRGAPAYEPENTLRSFRKALEMGVDWIELDVYAVENELMVIHDQRLERTTNGSGYVQESRVSYLRSLDAGRGERIPFLREVFELVDRRAGINIELKGPGCAAPVARLIEEMVAAGGWSYEQIIVSSFDHPQLQAIGALHRHLRIGALIYGIPLRLAQPAADLRAYSLHPGLEFINEQLVEDARRRGLKIFVYTVNSADDLKQAQQLGVDGVFTNDPALLSGG